MSERTERTEQTEQNAQTIESLKQDLRALLSKHQLNSLAIVVDAGDDVNRVTPIAQRAFILRHVETDKLSVAADLHQLGVWLSAMDGAQHLMASASASVGKRIQLTLMILAKEMAKFDEKLTSEQAPQN